MLKFVLFWSRPNPNPQQWSYYHHQIQLQAKYASLTIQVEFYCQPSNTHSSIEWDEMSGSKVQTVKITMKQFKYTTVPNLNRNRKEWEKINTNVHRQSHTQISRNNNKSIRVLFQRETVATPHIISYWGKFVDNTNWTKVWLFPTDIWSR